MADISKIKVTGITYDIKDETARSGLSDKVSKSGDTMTGLLNLISPTVDMTTTPSSEVVYDPLYILDKNGASIGNIRCRQNSANAVQLELNARRVINGSTIFNGLKLAVAADGTRSVGIDDAVAWRKALNGQEIKVRSGTTVITPSANSTSETVITSAQLATLFGISGSSPSNTTVVMSNGDYVANAIGVSSIYNSNVAGWKALFSEATSTPVRVNWIAIYFGL